MTDRTTAAEAANGTLAAEIVDGFQASIGAVPDPEDRHLARTLLALLAKGEPIDEARLAGAVGRPGAEVAKALAEPSFERLLYRDDEERILGFGGLGVGDLAETPHRLKLDGRELYAWCAADALYLPIVLDREARVESICPTTGERINLTVSPGGFRDLEPDGTVMSMLGPDEVVARAQRGEDVIRSNCHFIHFFASEKAARSWIDEHPGTVEFSIDEGFEFGRRWVARQWGVGVD